MQALVGGMVIQTANGGDVDQWKGGLDAAKERDGVLATVVQGKIPDDLCGYLFRCGPGRIMIGRKRYGHWFDGDGMVHSLSIDPKEQRALYKNKFVRTPRFIKQEKSGQTNSMAVKGAWTPADSFMCNWGLPTNPGNTSVMFLNGKLYALCEAGKPFEIDPGSLETKGSETFNDTLPGAFSAHYKVCSKTGQVWNVGMVAFSTIPSFVVYCVDPESQSVSKKKKIAYDVKASKNLYFIHDFAISENYIAIFIFPYKASILNTALSITAFCRPLGKQFRWEEGDGNNTRLIVLRREDLRTVVDQMVPNFSSYHYANAFESEDGKKLSILVDHLNGPRQELENQFYDMYEAKFDYGQTNDLYRHDIDLSSVGESEASFPTNVPVKREPVMTFSKSMFEGDGKTSGIALPLEFPEISSRVTGLPNRYIFSIGFTLREGPRGFMDCLQKIDLDKKTSSVFTVAEGSTYFHEPVFVPRRNASEKEDDGYIIASAYISKRHATDFFILDASKDFADPKALLARLSLPDGVHIPYTFHGKFVEDSSLAV